MKPRKASKASKASIAALAAASKAREMAALDSTEAWLRAALADASHFTCTIFQGRRYHTARFGSLEEARAFAPKLEAMAGNGRLAMVYVVHGLNLSTFVPRDWPSATA